MVGARRAARRRDHSALRRSPGSSRPRARRLGANSPRGRGSRDVDTGGAKWRLRAACLSRVLMAIGTRPSGDKGCHNVRSIDSVVEHYEVFVGHPLTTRTISGGLIRGAYEYPIPTYPILHRSSARNELRTRGAGVECFSASLVADHHPV
jgi:hypothetical protein